jgi:hypothetical protein
VLVARAAAANSHRARVGAHGRGAGGSARRRPVHQRAQAHDRRWEMPLASRRKVDHARHMNSIASTMAVVRAAPFELARPRTGERILTG